MTGEVAGYSGVTASGAGYTGAAPVAVVAPSSSGYPVTAPPSEVVFGDSEGLVVRPGDFAKDPENSTAVWSGLSALPPADTEDVIRADNRSEEERERARRYAETYLALKEKYPWFDGSPGAWIFVSLHERAEGIDRANEALKVMDGLSRGRLSSYYDSGYQRVTAPPILRFQPRITGR